MNKVLYQKFFDCLVLIPGGVGILSILANYKRGILDLSFTFFSFPPVMTFSILSVINLVL